PAAARPGSEARAGDGRGPERGQHRGLVDRVAARARRGVADRRAREAHRGGAPGGDDLVRRRLAPRAGDTDAERLAAPAAPPHPRTVPRRAPHPDRVPGGAGAQRALLPEAALPQRPELAAVAALGDEAAAGRADRHAPDVVVLPRGRQAAAEAPDDAP